MLLEHQDRPEPPDIEVITKSRIATFNTCQRLHDLKYNQGWRPTAPREYADFGTVFHAGLEAWWRAFMLGRDADAYAEAYAAMVDCRARPDVELDDTAFCKAELLMMAYAARWAAEMVDLEVLGVELEFIAVLPGRRRLRIAGKLDALVKRRSTGQVGFVEHKTSGADLSAGATYWQRLRMDPQISIYYHGVRTLGHEPTFCIYDVVVRPAQKLLLATPEEKKKFTKEGKLYANLRAEDETLEAFKERMATKIMDAPDDFFARQEVPRLDSEIEHAIEDVTETALQIRSGAATGIAPRNPDACFKWGSVCEFFDVCSGVATIDDGKFVRHDDVHQELSLVGIRKHRRAA